MKFLSTVLFWTVAMAAFIPAVLGLLAGISVLAVVCLAGFVLLLVALAVVILCCVPVLWWCALWESTQTLRLLNKIRGIKQQPAVN